MKRTMALMLLLSAASVALAQPGARPSPPGEAPAELGNGKAKRIGHFDSKQMLRLAVGLTHPDPAGEEQFVRDLATPGSPNFRKFMTADEWNARFAPSAEDEQAVVDWARDSGLTVTHRFRNRLIVDLEGPAGVVERALKVTINTYGLEDDVYYSNEREPAVPERLSRIVHSVSG